MLSVQQKKIDKARRLNQTAKCHRRLNRFQLRAELKPVPKNSSLYSLFFFQIQCVLQSTSRRLCQSSSRSTWTTCRSSRATTSSRDTCIHWEDGRQKRSANTKCATGGENSRTNCGFSERAVLCPTPEHQQQPSSYQTTSLRVTPNTESAKRCVLKTEVSVVGNYFCL